MSEPSDLDDYIAKQAVEYGTYVATGPIFHNGARAYNEGDPVPVSNVEEYKYLDQKLVRRVEDPAPEPTAPAPLPVGDPIVVNPGNPTETKD